MMTEPIKILAALFGKVKILSQSENMDFFKLRAECSIPLEVHDSVFNNNFTHVQDIDQWQITCEDGESPFTYDNTDIESIGLFFERWHEYVAGADSDDKCIISIRINKRIHNKNLIFIYSYEDFTGYLTQLYVIDFISIISKHLTACNGVAVFVVSNLSASFSTNSLYFVSKMPDQDLISNTDHTKVWDKLKSVCQFSGIENCNALPSDFEVITKGSIPASLSALFEKCCLVLLLAIFWDFMHIKNNKLSGRLNGYKTINADFDILQLSTSSLSNYYTIYSWLIKGGSLQDKMSISRNLISFNLDNVDKYSLPDAVYPSILSAYNIYERQHIKQYIELRNKMSDQLIGFNEKAGKIIETFAGSFQKSALAVVSLYASMIIARVLSSQSAKVAFTLDATIVSLAFLLISLVYFFISRWEVRQHRLRYKENYENMKKRNEDLLTKDDIQVILNDDREYKADMVFINGKLRLYSFLWVFLLSLLAFITLLLFFFSRLALL